MKKYNKIGFIGCGKMAGAIIQGVNGKGFEILASKSSPDNLIETSKKLGVEITLDNKFLVQNSEVIFLAVKPNQVEAVLEEIKEFITPEKLIVSVAAGVTKGFIKNII